MYRKIGIYVAATLGVYLAFRFLLPLALPFVIAGIVAVLYYPLLRKMFGGWGLQDGRLKRGLLAVAVLLLYAVIILTVCLLFRYLCGQGKNFVLHYPTYEAKARGMLRACCCRLDDWFRLQRGDCYRNITEWLHACMKESGITMIPQVTTFSVQAIGGVFRGMLALVVAIVATFFMILDYERIRAAMLRAEAGRVVCRTIMVCKTALLTYGKAQGLICLLNGAVCVTAFYLAKWPYAVLLGIGVAIVDALPVLGAGMILLPCAVYALLLGNVKAGAVLAGAYLCCIVIRQIAEPHMMGKGLGLHPLLSVVSIYIGFRLFGVPGLILGPVGVLIVRQVVLLANER